MLAASALAASFLGREAFADSDSTVVAIVALAAFVVSIVASVHILMPKQDLVFSQSGPGLYEGLYGFREDPSEAYRRLAYELYRFWESNDGKMRSLFGVYRLAAVGLVVEILALVVLVSGTLV